MFSFYFYILIFNSLEVFLGESKYLSEPPDLSDDYYNPGPPSSYYDDYIDDKEYSGADDADFDYTDIDDDASSRKSSSSTLSSTRQRLEELSRSLKKVKEARRRRRRKKQGKMTPVDRPRRAAVNTVNSLNPRLYDVTILEYPDSVNDGDDATARQDDLAGDFMNDYDYDFYDDQPDLDDLDYDFYNVDADIEDLDYDFYNIDDDDLDYDFYDYIVDSSDFGPKKIFRPRSRDKPTVSRTWLENIINFRNGLFGDSKSVSVKKRKGQPQVKIHYPNPDGKPLVSITKLNTPSSKDTKPKQDDPVKDSEKLVKKIATKSKSSKGHIIQMAATKTTTTPATTTLPPFPSPAISFTPDEPSNHQRKTTTIQPKVDSLTLTSVFSPKEIEELSLKQSTHNQLRNDNFDDEEFFFDFPQVNANDFYEKNIIYEEPIKSDFSYHPPTFKIEKNMRQSSQLLNPPNLLPKKHVKYENNYQPSNEPSSSNEPHFLPPKHGIFELLHQANPDNQQMPPRRLPTHPPHHHSTPPSFSPHNSPPLGYLPSTQFRYEDIYMNINQNMIN